MRHGQRFCRNEARKRRLARRQQRGFRARTASGHGQRGSQTFAVKHAVFGRRQPNIPHRHAELVSASHKGKETLKQVQGDEEGGVRETKRVGKLIISTGVLGLF